MTGISYPKYSPIKMPTDYVEGMEKALIDKLMAVEMYRIIMWGLPYVRFYQDMMYEIITDEQKHNGKLNHLIMVAAHDKIEKSVKNIQKRLNNNVNRCRR